MQKITLKRTGNRPIEFDGELLSSVNTRQLSGPGSIRYWKMSLYSSGDGCFVFLCEYISEWKGEHGFNEVIVVNSIELLVKNISNCDYFRNVIGFPQGMPEKQARLISELKRCVDGAITSLFLNLDSEKLINNRG